MANRCETVLPLSEDYFSVIGYQKLWFIGVDAVLTVAILLLLLDDIVFVCRTYTHEDIKNKSVWLIAVYPVMALSALLSVCIPRASYVCDFVSTVYLAACLSQFSSLILLYFGNRENLLMKVKDTGFSLRTRPLCCCCCCCPTLKSTLKNLFLLRVMILQTAIIQPIVQFISAVLWADNKFDKSGIDFRKSFVYLTTAKVMSTIIALHALNALHSATVLHLRTHSMAVKKLMLQLVLIFQNIQGATLSILARFDIPPCTSEFSSYSQMQEWHHLVLVVEMFLLALVARIFYRRPLQLDAALEEQSTDAVSIYVTRNERAVQPFPVSIARASLGLDFSHESSPTPAPAGGDVTGDKDGHERRHDSDGTECHRDQDESQDTKSSLADDVDCTDNLHTDIPIRGWK